VLKAIPKTDAFVAFASLTVWALMDFHMVEDVRA
jgi:hypothetical protein